MKTLLGLYRKRIMSLAGCLIGGLKLLIDGKIQKKGVFAPEGVINPYDFFKELNGMSDALDLDEDINTNGPEMVNIFRSW